MRRKSSRPVLEAGEREQSRSPSHHLHHVTLPDGTRLTQVLRLSELHGQVLRLLGPAYENAYLAFQETAD
jgi:hypothetical protein